MIATYLRRPATWILLVANMAPFVGVLFWHWDAFVLLMLYWLETAVIAFWTVVRIATMSQADLDDMHFDGSARAPSGIGLALFFTAHAGIFMGVHFMFLWALFSGDWPQRIHGVRSFVAQMVVATGLWLPLIVLFIGRGLLVLYETARPVIFRVFRLVPRKGAQGQSKPGEALLVGLYLRIFVMQVTIILGAWVALLIGTTGAYLFLIAVKTAVDVSLQALMETFHVSMLKAKAAAAAKSEA